MNYTSTRGGETGVSASQAILKGLACDGGLFMPEEIPTFDFDISELKGKTYGEVAYEILKLYLTDFTEEELKGCISKAYDSKFDTEEIVPLTFADGAYYLELFHGKTIAFKDMALSILPHLMTTAARKNDVRENIMILTATSGDTGKAAMAGFADVPGTQIVVFYPKGGVSNVQRLQMTTQRGANVDAVAVHGNFDDAQTGVKKIFGDTAYRDELKSKGIILSSANSINIGRLIPQIVYYVYAYVKLLDNNKIKEDEKINICVPTGNFGNILSAYFAKKMGLPVDKLICASNSNKVLYDFFKTGTYDKKREFILTTSPSMDILVSSNLERLIYLSCGCDAVKTAGLMKDLSEKGEYTVDSQMREFMSDFKEGYSNEEEVCSRIKSLYESTGYVIDTHTAVASSVYDKYVKESGDETLTVVASTASPYKFATTVVSAIGGNTELDDFEIMDELSKLSNVTIPAAIEEIRAAKELHTDECDVDKMKEAVSKNIK